MRKGLVLEPSLRMEATTPALALLILETTWVRLSVAAKVMVFSKEPLRRLAAPVPVASPARLRLRATEPEVSSILMALAPGGTRASWMSRPSPVELMEARTPVADRLISSMRSPSVRVSAPMSMVVATPAPSVIRKRPVPMPLPLFSEETSVDLLSYWR